MKVCTQCKIEKTLDSFYKTAANKKDGLKSECKDCNKARVKKGYADNIEVRRAAKREQSAANMDVLKARMKSYYANNKAKVLVQKINYYHANKAKIRIASNKWERNKRQTDPLWRLIKNYRDRIRKTCSQVTFTVSKLKYLGCSSQEFMDHLEKGFTNDMNWDNYGTVWQVDHIIPLAWFNINSEACRAKAFHYTNTQALLSIDNARKRDKWHDFKIDLKLTA